MPLGPLELAVWLGNWPSLALGSRGQRVRIIFRSTVICILALNFHVPVAALVQPLPGLTAFPNSLQNRLRQEQARRGEAHVPRTRHLSKDGQPLYTNRLILEASPYLVQHAHNPVNWYAWGKDAFASAKKEDKPILLSVGYSTCFWCHVMARESFEDTSVAEYLNRHYIAIKVDREERPDVDAVYMGALRLMTGTGGWPSTVWLTPERKPFYGGTYFPSKGKAAQGGTGFLTVLSDMNTAFHERRVQVNNIANKIASGLAVHLVPDPDGKGPTSAVIFSAVSDFQSKFDTANGGFGAAPKFPRSVVPEFLLRSYRRTGDVRTRLAVEETLVAMASGGIYDQVGGGFHRYATDRAWRIPHFEKMLYDNAQLAAVYLEAYQTTNKQEFCDIAAEVLDYLLRDMVAPEGGFYSASDAESAGGEGHYYLWNLEELRERFSSEEVRLIEAHYGFGTHANWDGRKILHVKTPLNKVAEEIDRPLPQIRKQLVGIKRRLLRMRKQRPAPLLDKKVLTSWNGLAISAFAKGYQILSVPAYLNAAERAAGFILRDLNDHGRLRRSVTDTSRADQVYLDDYAFFIAGLLDLYETNFDYRWLERAIALQGAQDDLFLDEENGGYFLTAVNAERLLVPIKSAYDGALPSGNSVSVQNLLRIAEWTGQNTYRRRALNTLTAFGSELHRNPMNMPRMLSALDFYLDSPKQIAIIKGPVGGTIEDFLSKVKTQFLPNRVIALTAKEGELNRHLRIVPWLKDKVAIDGKTTAYVCENYSCRLPTTEPSVFANQIAVTKPLVPGSREEK